MVCVCMSAQIHDRLVAKSQWEGKLSSVSWRIDVQATSKNAAGGALNEPTAIVELVVQQVCNTVDHMSFVFAKDWR